MNLKINLFYRRGTIGIFICVVLVLEGRGIRINKCFRGFLILILFLYGWGLRFL